MHVSSASARAPAAPGVMPAVAPVAAAVGDEECCMHGNDTSLHDDCYSLLAVAPNSRMQGRWNSTGTPRSAALTADMSPAPAAGIFARSASTVRVWQQVSRHRLAKPPDPGSGSKSLSGPSPAAGSGSGSGPGPRSSVVCGGGCTSAADV